MLAIQTYRLARSDSTKGRIQYPNIAHDDVLVACCCMPQISFPIGKIIGPSLIGAILETNDMPKIPS